MLQKSHLERVLKINGVSPTASDEVIRELLISARYSENEIESALTVLRENTVTHDSTLESSHKIFRGDSSLNPQEILKLLGIDVDLTKSGSSSRITKQRSTSHATEIAIFVTVVVIVVAISSLFLFDIG